MNKPLTPNEASAGHNRPAVLTADMLERDFAYLDKALDEIERDTVAKIPPVCEDDEDLEVIRSAVKRLTGAYNRLEAVRVEAKEPYLAATRVNDAHFNLRKAKVEKWKASGESIAHRYLKKKEAEERALREEAARKAADDARKATEDARLAEQARIELEQASLAEAFAVSPSPTTVPDQIETSAARIEETSLRTTAIQKNAEALQLQEAAAAKPADLARTRTGSGLSTLQEIWCFEVENMEQIDLEALRSHIPLADLKKAIQRYVAVNKGDRPLKGVRIYSDTKPVMT